MGEKESVVNPFEEQYFGQLTTSTTASITTTTEDEGTFDLKSTSASDPQEHSAETSELSEVDEQGAYSIE